MPMEVRLVQQVTAILRKVQAEEAGKERGQMKRYRHKILKELWYNRPWVYLPEVFRFMKKYPLEDRRKLKTWLRNCFYLNWQNCLVERKGWGK